MALTKQQLLDIVSQRADVSKADVERVLNGLSVEVISQLNTEGKIAVPGLGTFTIAVSAPRTARNPHTGEPVEVPAKRKAKFKPSSHLAQSVDYAR